MTADNQILIDNGSGSFHREPELCTFELLSDDPRCMICGKRCVPGMKQWHPGPVLTFSGSFKTQEYLELGEPRLHDVVLKKSEGQIIPDLPIVITSCEMIDKTTWEYSFKNSAFVGHLPPVQ